MDTPQEEAINHTILFSPLGKDKTVLVLTSVATPIIPRAGERVTINGTMYHVVNIFHEYKIKESGKIVEEHDVYLLEIPNGV